MGFALDPTRPLPEELRRVARERLDEAVELLEGETDEPLETRVHEARKRTKEVRAVLRLTRHDLGSAVYRAHNRRLRDAARLLAPVRDAQVLRDLAARAGDGSDGPAARAAEAFETRLRSEKGRIAQAQTVRHSAEAVAGVRAEIGEWPLVQDRWRAVGPGLRESARRARARMADVRATPTPERRHEWRKRVKDHWYHLCLLTPAWPDLLGAHAEEGHRLSDLLGDAQDLAVFARALDDRALGLRDADRSALTEWARTGQVPLVTEALRLGARVHAETPKRFEGRAKAVWRAARDTDPRAAEIAAGADAEAVPETDAAD